MGKGDGAGEGTGQGAGEYKGKTERIAVPAMPMPMAVLCCVLNFILPGFGTILAGTSIFCCSRNEDITHDERWVSCLTSLGIGLLQLLTTVFFLVGWIWSIVWGIFFLMMSSEYYHRNRAYDTDGNTGMVISAQPGIQMVTLNTPQAPAGHMVNIIRQPTGPQFGGGVISTGPATVITTPTAAPYTPIQKYPANVAPPPYSGPPPSWSQQQQTMYPQ